MEFNNRRKIWLVCTILTFSLFWGWIPIAIYNESVFLFSGIGGILFAVFLGLFFGDFTSLSEFIESDTTKSKSNPKKYVGLVVLPGIALIFIFMFHFFNRKDEAIDKEGLIAKGRVVNGESRTSTRRMQTSTTYEIEVTFVAENGIPYRFKESVNSSEFNQLYQDAEIDVRYWKKAPFVAKAVLSSEEIKKAFKIEDRPLVFLDIEKIYSGEIKPDSIVGYLNKINYKWETKQGLYLNNKMNMAIKRDTANHALIYIESKHPSSTDISFEESLIKSNFKKSANNLDGKEIVNYKNDKFIIYKTTKTSLDDSSNGIMKTITVMNIFTIISK